MSTLASELSSTSSLWRWQNGDPCSQLETSGQVLPGSTPVLARLAETVSKACHHGASLQAMASRHLSPLWSPWQQSHAPLWIWLPLRDWSCWAPSCYKFFTSLWDHSQSEAALPYSSNITHTHTLPCSLHSLKCYPQFFKYRIRAMGVRLKIINHVFCTWHISDAGEIFVG